MVAILVCVVIVIVLLLLVVLIWHYDGKQTRLKLIDTNCDDVIVRTTSKEASLNCILDQYTLPDVDISPDALKENLKGAAIAQWIGAPSQDQFDLMCARIWIDGKTQLIISCQSYLSMPIWINDVRIEPGDTISFPSVRLKHTCVYAGLNSRQSFKVCRHNRCVPITDEQVATLQASIPYATTGAVNRILACDAATRLGGRLSLLELRENILTPELVAPDQADGKTGTILTNGNVEVSFPGRLQELIQAGDTTVFIVA